tara:strand:+ start:9094 stop:9993 length:900 start_codon:yes stop_codon:yes gene_type:complete
MLENKMNRKNITEKFVLTLLVISFSACSVLGQWWYDRLDNYITSYFLEYAKFSSEQESYIRKITKKYHNWNSTFELPKYRELLVEVKNLSDKTTNKDIEKIHIKGWALVQESNNFFIPYITTFCKNLTDTQVEEISLKLKERIGKWESSVQESEKEESIKDSIKLFSRMSRFLGVKLTETQKIELKKLYSNIDNSEIDSMERQKIWNAKFVSILKSRREGSFNSELKVHLDSLLIKQQSEKENAYNEMIAITIASLNEKQKTKFQNRINFFILSLDKIIKSQEESLIDELEYFSPHHGQ